MLPTRPRRNGNIPTKLSNDFRERADSAAFYEAWVGAVLSRAGLWTLHHPFTLAETREQIVEYAQTWDMSVGPNDFSNTEDPENPFYDVEVKSVNLTFHNTDTYPFPRVLVCSQASWERKWYSSVTVVDFLFVSRPTGCILWLPQGTKVEMNKTVTDTMRDQTYKAVDTDADNLCPLSDFVEKVRGA